MMSKPPRIRLEGWLLKKKSKEKSSVLFKNENLRWFRIQELEVLLFLALNSNHKSDV